MSRINIILDNYNGRCYAGNVIAGKLECYFAKPKKFRDITVKCEGKEHTSWTVTETYTGDNNKTETRHVTYTGEHQVYLNRICLVKSRGDNDEVPPGKYVYPFSFLLPDNLPSTYDSEYGYIRYKIKGVVNRPWRFDYECDIFIIVASPIDLNKILHVKNPVTVSDEKNLCCFWCKSGPVSITATLPHSGFAPGETVTCSAYIQNLSNVTVKGINFKIAKHVEFKVESPGTKTKTKEETVASATYGRIGAHGEHSFTVDLTIPENCEVPNFSNCTLFHSKYTFTVFKKVEVRLPCPHVNLDEQALVTMGNIKLGLAQPFVPVNQNLIVSPYPVVAPSAPLPEMPAAGYQEGNSSKGPPSYDQVMQSGNVGFSVQSMPMPPLPFKE